MYLRHELKAQHSSILQCAYFWQGKLKSFKAIVTRNTDILEWHDRGKIIETNAGTWN